MMYLFLPTRSISCTAVSSSNRRRLCRVPSEITRSKCLVAERIAVLRAIAEQIRLDLLARIGEAVLRDVEAGDLQLGQELLHLVEQERLAAADVENLGSVLEPVDVDQRLRHRRPAAVDELVAAVAVAAVAVPVVELVFLRLQHAVDLVVDHARQVVALGRLMQRRHDVQQSTHSCPSPRSNLET